MKDFDQRWQTLARRASGLPAELPGELPFGFATRILAQYRQAPAEPWEEIFSLVGVRALLVTSFLALVGAGVGFYDWYDFRIERPRLEQTLTSELPLPWP